MIKRIIALTAVLLLILPLCAGCNNKKGRGVGGEKLLRPDLEPEHVDFEGHEFIVADFNGGRWQRQEESNPYNDAWQRVLDNVEQNFNCTINFHQTSPGGVWDEAYPEIAAGEKYADIICATKWHFGKLLGSDLMLDLNLLSTNWNNIWWNQNIRKISTIKDKTYAGGGSFIFDAVYTWILNFNFDIWRELQLPDPYELVQNGEWTIDLLIEYSKKAMMDKDGTGIVDSA
ncbi:MAG: extracellular solute-binding protein, partial [Oscillospiraceae bacterium]|nr:extracellular solute-binding protein [Oscillospiraceae bacterium]